MPRPLTIALSPSAAASPDAIRETLAASLGISAGKISGYRILRRSLDARGRQVKVILQTEAYVDEPFFPPAPATYSFRDVHKAPHRVVIIGAGPAGLFAALRLLESGIKPVVLERGKDVRARRRDLARINKEGMVNPDSNYCFGEGGAGTYSDGKLYTRSHKRGDINRILNLFVQFGADENILSEAHPHIGTNKLPHIITAMREQIRAAGGEIWFEQKLTGLVMDGPGLRAVRTASGERWEADAFILATGHSARDVFQLLNDQQLQLEAKPFALGVRVEHPQELIDRAQYHCDGRDPWLPPAAYSWVEQVEGRGVFSFCMCPGGIIAPAATAPGELVVNGWSPSKRNNPFANSGIVVSVEPADWQAFADKGPLAALHFQQAVEQRAFAAGGGRLVAPAQRLVDFADGRISTQLPDCSYLPGIRSVALETVLPGFIHQRLQAAFRAHGRKMKGYFTNEAVVVATESRTSSPVRIPRDTQTLAHPQLNNFYPCGEGAGYAGGIVSAAMDGERVADRIVKTLKN